jgi:zinc transport system substrate-binding protein
MRALERVVLRWLAATAIVVATLLLPAVPARADGPAIVVSIKPLHSLVTSLMEGVDVPMLLVEGAASPHAFSLRPSQAQALSSADLVVWVGEGLESFLVAPMRSLVLAGHGFAIAELPGIDPLPMREGGIWAAHHHDDDAHDDDGHEDDVHDSHLTDPHLWLDTGRAVRIVEALAARLSAIDPAHADAYESNRAALVDRIERTDDSARALLRPVRDLPYIVFHDAYQYFERRYGMAAAGSISLDPEQAPSAARLAEIRDRLAAGGIVCAFAEPQFDSGLLETAVAGSTVRIARLDPLGANLEPGPGLYPQLIEGLARDLAACLGGQG